MLQGQINRQFGAWQPGEQLKWKRTLDAHFWVFPPYRDWLALLLGAVAVCCEDKSWWQTGPGLLFPGPHGEHQGAPHHHGAILPAFPEQGEGITDWVSLTVNILTNSHRAPMGDLGFIYLLSSRSSPCLAPWSPALGVPHSTTVNPYCEVVKHIYVVKTLKSWL